ncbi:MAG: hypothetical protein ACI9QA_000692 [Methanobacteriota archaeon]|jgi:hypothetical protein|uniref:Uncharacterized protein n=1 Tax=Halorutilus salinus TaxID=2487751 RepID=A0A9Q4C629_9EURY|nr:hypothetical protein [Halorutilus salinus]MCX2819956.1 hypothetical protein [Halorutilus salinus]
MPSSNFERLAGGMLIISQGATTLVLGEAGVFSSLVRTAVAVAFLSAGTSVVARKTASKGGSLATVYVSVGWMLYAVYVGGVNAVPETPFLGLVGAAVVYRAHLRREEEEASHG